MTAHRDPDELIHRFLLEGSERLHDQVYDAVRATIEQKRQRVVIGPWRMPTIMNRYVPIGLGAAAVVGALAIGTQLMGGPAPGGAASAPSPSPSPTASPTPSADAFLPTGAYEIVDRGSPNSPVRITVTIPASGWTSFPEFGGLGKGDDEDPPEAAMLAWSWPAGTGFYVYGDPCQWESTTPATPVTTVDDIAAALAAQASRDASDPENVTVGGYTGKKITLHVPTDAATREEAFKDCDRGTFASYGTGGPGSEPNRYHQGPGQVDEFWILDVDGAVVILDAMYRPETPADLRDELRAIAQSAAFE